MTLTLRIDDNSPEAANLELVKQVFDMSSATKAIFAALEYAKEKKERHQQISDLAKKWREESARADCVLYKVKQYFEIEEWLKEQILTL